MIAFFKMIASITQYISEAAMRIFAPTDDAYPIIGMQPFTGEPYKKGIADSW
ncbi:MAG: nicotinate phosphoribosyltransferase [Heteroscytonema crispum UTEX LB 1556]